MKKHIALLLFAVFWLTACSNGEKYISLPDDISLIEDENNDNYSQGIDDVNYFALYNSTTFDGRFLISAAKRTDTTDGKVYDRCTIIGCEHNVSTCGNNFPMSSPKFRYDRVYYVDNDDIERPSKVCYEKDGEQTVIFESSYISTEDKNEKRSAMIYNIILVEDGIICFGGNDVFKIDYDGKLIAQPIECGSGGLLSGTVIDKDHAAMTDMNYQMFVADLSSGSAVKISDFARAVSYCDGKLYYLNNKTYYHKLMRCDIDGKNAETLIDDCYYYTFTDNYIFYYTKDDEYTIYRYDKNSGKTDKTLSTMNVLSTEEDWEIDEGWSDLRYYPYYKLLLIDTFCESAQTSRKCLLDKNGDIVKIFPARPLF